MNTESLNAELLKDAIAIIDGIPSNRVSLTRWQQTYINGRLVERYLHYVKDASAITCNTVACAGGWLSLHPKFRECGLFASTNYGGEPVMMVDQKIVHSGFHALARLFDIRYVEARALFCSRREFEDRKYGHMDDRQLWLHRAGVLLTNRAGFRKEFVDDPIMHAQGGR